jgi:Flp pilus assembly protein TadG
VTQINVRLRGLAGGKSGSVAVEFAMLSAVFVSLLLGIIQFSLYFVAALTLRTALSETVAYASVFSNTASFAETRDQAKVREVICANLLLVADCTKNLKLEQMPLASLPNNARVVSGTVFQNGVPGDVLVRRAEAEVFTFVPGLKPLRIRSSSVFLSR